MKKLSLIIIFAVCFAFVYGQKSNYSFLKHVTTNLPDSIYVQSGYEKQMIYKVWEAYETNPVNSDESYTDKESRDYYFDYSELNDVMRLIDENNINILEQNFDKNCSITISFEQDKKNSIINLFNQFKTLDFMACDVISKS